MYNVEDNEFSYKWNIKINCLKNIAGETEVKLLEKKLNQSLFFLPKYTTIDNFELFVEDFNLNSWK